MSTILYWTSNPDLADFVKDVLEKHFKQYDVKVVSKPVTTGGNVDEIVGEVVGEMSGTDIALVCLDGVFVNSLGVRISDSSEYPDRNVEQLIQAIHNSTGYKGDFVNPQYAGLYPGFRQIKVRDHVERVISVKEHVNNPRDVTDGANVKANLSYDLVECVQHSLR